MRKRLLAVLLAVIMMLTLVPSNLIIAKAEESDTVEYKKIYTIADLAAIENDMSGHYMLMNDIDMSETKKGGTWDSGTGWTALGYNQKTEFSGELEGNGYSLLGLNQFGGTYGGLFWKISGTVRNLFIKDCNIACKEETGSFAAFLNKGRIKNCGSVKGLITQTTTTRCGLGGLVGSEDYANQSSIKGQIVKCFNSATIVSKGDNSTRAYVGGIIGTGNFLNVTDSYNCGDIIAIEKSAAVYGIGYCVNATRCYNTGILKRNTSDKYSLIYPCSDQSNVACYYSVDCLDGDVASSGQTSTPKSDAQMKIQTTYVDWDFDNVWYIDPDSDYPYPQLRKADKKIESIEWKKTPERKTYYLGQAIDPGNGQITVYYIDDTSETIDVTSDMLSGYDMSKIGTQTVTLTYKDKSLSYTINVKDVLSVTQISEPGKTEFAKGTAFDFSGWKVRITYTDGDIEDVDVTPSMTTGGNINVVGEYTVKAVIAGQEFEQKIKVAPIKVESIKVISLPTKMNYVVDEPFDTTGMVVQAVYNNGTTKEINDYVIEGYEATLGIHTIVVSYQGFTAEFDVEVEKGNPTAIAVTQMPDKTEYIEGQAFDKTGMVVQVAYSNGFKKTITDYTVSDIPAGLGSRKVTISCGNVSTYIYVKVKEKELESIVVDTLPSKTLYVEGEKFEKDGIVVKAVYNNGKSEEVTDYVLSGVDMSQIGTHQVTVSYQGLTVTFDIEVIGKSLKELSATGLVKTEYMPNEKLDLTGLVVKAVYNNGTSAELSKDDYTVSGFTGTVGNNIISISYGGKTTTLVVIVHNPSGEWVVTKEATCTSEGERVQYCKDCDKELYREKIERKAHTPVIDPAVAATCTTDGKTEGSHCSVCGEVITKQENVPALGHSFGEWESVSKATCESTGVLKRVCSVCGVEETKKDPATGHDYISSVVKPTCTKGGYTQHICTKCGDSYKDTYTLPVEHDYISQVTRNATCTSEGVKTYMCTNCGDTYTEKIAKLPHSDITETTPATTAKNGVRVKKCKVCGDVASRTTIYRPAKVTLSKTSFVYNGKVQKPVVAIKDASGKIIPSTAYTLTYSRGCKAAGKYTVKITFKGSYQGSVNKTYTIVPKATSISKISSGKKNFTVAWKKQAQESSGYEIQYSAASNFKGAKTVAISGNSTTTKKITGLTSKKKYYVRVRVYKKSGNTKCYSAWSGAKAVVVK